jgi:hypothetical protein
MAHLGAQCAELRFLASFQKPTDDFDSPFGCPGGAFSEDKSDFTAILCRTFLCCPVVRLGQRHHQGESAGSVPCRLLAGV